MAVIWKMTLVASNNDDAQKLIVYAKELNKEFKLKTYSGETMDGLEFLNDGFCFTDGLEGPIQQFHNFTDQVVAHFPAMNLKYTQIGDDGCHACINVNRNGVLVPYVPGQMYIYVANPNDYTTLKAHAEKILKEHKFVIALNDEDQTISWEYGFVDDDSKAACDTIIASLSKAMPNVKLVCFNDCSLWNEPDIEKYCYAIDGSFEWKSGGPSIYYLISEAVNSEMFTIPEAISDPMSCFEKMLNIARSGNSQCNFTLNEMLNDPENREIYLTKLTPEDKAWMEEFEN
jgi:hypothetical protein